MRLRSRGLGRKELVMDFREYEVIREGDEIVVVGTIRDPVNWDFSLRICEDDIPGLARLLLRRYMFAHLFRALFKLLKHHLWSQDLAEHIAEGKLRVGKAREKAQERLIKGEDPLATRRRPTRRTRPSTASTA